MSCVSVIFLAVAAIFTIVSMIRWYEQATEAIELGWWNKIFVLLACPFAVWFFPSRVAVGRPIPVPHHEPVRGFGTMPKAPAPPPQATTPPRAPAGKKKSGIDAEQVAKLREKMRQQGMLPPEE